MEGLAQWLKACANERNMLAQHVGHNMLRSFVHHVVPCCMMLVYVAFNIIVQATFINML